MIRLIAPALLTLALTTALLGSLFSTPANALDITQMTAAERTIFRAEVRAYLLDNPEVILEAVKLLEDRQVAAESQADYSLVANNTAELFDDGFSYVGGNPDGDITLVEFLDYRCVYCRRAMPEVDSLLASDGNIRLIVKEFPILGDGSVLASRFAIATKNLAGPAAYKQAHDALMLYQGEFTKVTLGRIADGLGLDTDAILAEMDSDATLSEIARTRDLAKRLQISGTPTFVLQDELLRGFIPADQMALIVGEKRANR
ncbi:MAG: DsbA family protein [Rhodobacteraceae bacterium]|nr:DsbA family protein [Paracoccaceae bacterium]